MMNFSKINKFTILKNAIEKSSPFIITDIRFNDTWSRVSFSMTAYNIVIDMEIVCEKYRFAAKARILNSGEISKELPWSTSIVEELEYPNYRWIDEFIGEHTHYREGRDMGVQPIDINTMKID